MPQTVKAMSDELRNTLGNKEMLRRLAGDKSYARGEGYFAGGMVRSIIEYDGKVAATVSGTEDYQVMLWLEDGAVVGDCSCPMGEGGVFCKHCVAVALTYAADEDGAAHNPASAVFDDEQRDDKRGGKSASAKRGGKRTQTLDDIKSFLESRSKQQLVALLLQAAFADKNWRERLRLEAARGDGSADGINLKAFRDAITKRTRVKDFVEYHEMRLFVRGLQEMVEQLRRLLSDGLARECVELCEFALERVEATIESVDDSDGYMSGVLDDLQQLHWQACQAAKPDAIELARKLFAWEMRSDWQVFYGAAETYKDVFGREGLSEYRRLAEKAWAKVTPRHPPNEAIKNKDSVNRYSFGFADERTLGEVRGEGKRFRIAHIMESLAVAANDVDWQVEIISRDLSHAYSFVRIAEILRAAGRDDEALKWAEQGAFAFEMKPDSRLQDILIDEYERRKRFADALKIVWQRFTEYSSPENYQHLKEHVEHAAMHNAAVWSEWRDKALNFMRETLDAKRKSKSLYAVSANTSLVTILLAEHDAEAAWHAANKYGCHEKAWMAVALAREQSHPDDAIKVYRRTLEETIDRKTNESYAEAVKRIKRIRELMHRTNRADEFNTLLTEWRERHKPKRNFMKLLAEVSPL